MKKIVALMMLCLSIGAQAHDHWHGGHHGGYRGGYGYGWVAPALIGGVIGYEMARPTPVIVQQPPVVVTPPPPPRTAFYCPTAQMYYPTVQTCNVPWQPVNY